MLASEMPSNHFAPLFDQLTGTLADLNSCSVEIRYRL